MHRLIRLFSTSIGRKLVLAVTGLMLLGFLMAHMLGNMSLFQSAESLNAYADWLQGHPLLWVMRLGLALVFVIHVYVAIELARENRAARPTRYAASQHFQTSWASRYMVFSGLLVLSFVVFHVLHFTFGAVASEGFSAVDSSGRHDVFSMIVSNFRNPWICGGYIVAMNLIGFHLFHGTRSLFQTVGVNHDSYNGSIRVVNLALVAIFVIGNCSIPILVYTGVIGLPGG
jgi:succinate dehydrogenase / fumarate reductase cytochrome b subunit